MKTLDEVIKAMELCDSDEGTCRGCAYEPDCDQKASLGHERKRNDALHYLREYRTCREDLIMNCKRHEELYIQYRDMIDELERNEPLTWNELMQMIGKPVWIEEGTDFEMKHWFIVPWPHPSYKHNRLEKDQIGEGWSCYHKDNLGKTWQAYRKERHEES